MTREELEAAVRRQVQRAVEDGKRLTRDGGHAGTEVITICIMAQVDAYVAAQAPSAGG